MDDASNGVDLGSIEEELHRYVPEAVQAKLWNLQKQDRLSRIHSLIFKTSLISFIIYS